MSGMREQETNSKIVPAIKYDVENVTDPQQPRQPTDLRDLLRFAADVAGDQDATRLSFKQMDDERRKWLENTLKGMTVNVVEELLKAIDVLKDAGSLELQDDTTNCENALDVVLDIVDNVDAANDFHKIGGFCIFPACLGSAHSSLRWRAAEIIADLTQNNRYCQEKVLDAKLLPVLISLIDNDPEEKVRVKALYAVSCLVRGNENALVEFVGNSGYCMLLRAIQSCVEKLQIKSAFLLNSLCHRNEKVKDELRKLGFVIQLAGMVSNSHQPIHDHLLPALFSLIKDHADSQIECRKPELNLQSTLSNLVNSTCAQEEYMEEHNYAQELLHFLFSAI